jgi:hypothetical protein
VPQTIGQCHSFARVPRAPQIVVRSAKVLLFYAESFFVNNMRARTRSSVGLLQLRILRLGFLEDGDVGVGVFPKAEEVLVGSACAGRAILRGVNILADAVKVTLGPDLTWRSESLRFLLRNQAGSLRLYSKPLRLRLQRSGTWRVPEKRVWFRHEPERQVERTRAERRQCPSTEAPGPYFQKEFFHNGYIKSLKQLVHFYNTRDKCAYAVTSGHCPAGKTEKVDCWPMPEVPNNIDMTTGNLGLTDKEEDQIVKFLETLSYGYTRPYPNVDTYTGACMTGGSAATQGNDHLIPAPPLPPCASAICAAKPVPGPKPISDMKASVLPEDTSVSPRANIYGSSRVRRSIR